MAWVPPESSSFASINVAFVAPPDVFFEDSFCVDEQPVAPLQWVTAPAQSSVGGWELRSPVHESDASTGSPDAIKSNGESSSSESVRSIPQENNRVQSSSRSKKRAFVECPLQLTARPPAKHSYLTQKEERDALAEEVRLLQQRVEELRLRTGLPTAQDKALVAKVQASNFDFEESIHANRLQLARMHSMVTRELLSMPVNPLSTHIHLPVDIDERRNLLRAIKDVKVRRAYEASVSFLEHNDPYKREDRFKTDDGLFHYNFYGVEHFLGLDSARPLYAAMQFFFSNMEIKAIEELGQLALLHDAEDIDPTVWNQHIVTEVVDGYLDELNAVGFTRFYEDFHGSQLGVFAYDTVDEDDLYPYQPLERTRKNLQACHTVSEWRRPGTNELVVVLRRCIFVAQYPPAFPMSPDAVENLHANMSAWIGVMTKFLREHMAAYRHDKV